MIIAMSIIWASMSIAALIYGASDVTFWGCLITCNVWLAAHRIIVDGNDN